MPNKDNPFEFFDHLPPDPFPMNDEEREQWEKRNEGERTTLEDLKKELGL